VPGGGRGAGGRVGSRHRQGGRRPGCGGGTGVAADEWLRWIRVRLQAGRVMRFRKVGTRRAQSISKVVMAVAWRDGVDGGPGGKTVWRDVHVVPGPVAATPIRVPRTEAVLEGSPPTPEVADRAAEVLAAELSPIDDEALHRFDEYGEARDEMLLRTDHPDAPLRVFHARNCPPLKSVKANPRCCAAKAQNAE